MHCFIKNAFKLKLFGVLSAFILSAELQNNLRKKPCLRKIGTLCPTWAIDKKLISENHSINQ